MPPLCHNPAKNPRQCVQNPGIRRLCAGHVTLLSQSSGVRGGHHPAGASLVRAGGEIADTRRLVCGARAAPEPAVHGGRCDHHRARDWCQHCPVLRLQHCPAAAAALQGPGPSRGHVHGSADAKQLRDAVLERELHRYPQWLTRSLRGHGRGADVAPRHPRRRRHARAGRARLRHAQLLSGHGGADCARTGFSGV